MIFKHVADIHSISKVAEKSGYVKSNVSQRMKILEDELGVHLLIRSNRKVRLMEEGGRCTVCYENPKANARCEIRDQQKERQRRLDYWGNTDHIGGDATKNLFTLHGRE
ncbi:LysR family transcriptional regulator [Exiguobacterium sp. ERU656]|uniref:helix-turn-helix domain-containing protein n=1 Tax=Exiguobacterium sp. ERU656 TaxID=2751217 RepID=UPI001BEB0D83|nr:LysR family transcriptional regulator [Exiguobacterium sp. ERU656]